MAHVIPPMPSSRFDTIRIRDRVFTCVRSDDARRKVMEPVLKSYLAQRDQLADEKSSRLRHMKALALGFDALLRLADPDNMTVLLNGRVIAGPIDPASPLHVEDDMVFDLLQFIIVTNFTGDDVARLSSHKKAA